MPHDAIIDHVILTLHNLSGYPFLPCPICRGTEGCDHTVIERARRTHPGMVYPFTEHEV